MTPNTVEETLNDRKNTHGKWTDNAQLAQHLKGAMTENHGERPSHMNEAIDMICHKLARIVHGNPMEPDHWHDIQGYAALVEKELLKPLKRSHEANCSLNSVSGQAAGVKVKCTCKAGGTSCL